MARKLDRVVIVDVEATCWEKDPPSGEQNEIIEIGICEVDLLSSRIGKSGSIVTNIEEPQCILVKPQYSTVSDFCTKLTTLTAADLKNGTSFGAACDTLRSKYKTHLRTWASWGDYDRNQFDRQCRSNKYNARYPFGPTHLNVKNLFALEWGLNHEVGMIEALKLTQIPLEGTHHRGVDDAKNIAKILQFILQRN